MIKISGIIIFSYLVAALIWPALVSAANPALDRLNAVAVTGGPYQGDATILGMVGTAVGVGLGLIGVVFLLLMLFAGYNWMTAHGEEEKVTKAKSIIIQTTIGLLIIIGAYAAWKFAFKIF